MPNSFPNSPVRITHRWGGLQSFTADDFPEVGLFDERQIYGVAGFSGRGNCYSDVGTQYVVGKAVGTPSAVEEQFGTLIETVMPVRRPAAWGPSGKFAVLRDRDAERLVGMPTLSVGTSKKEEE